MVTVDESVRSLLRSSEELKVTLEAAFVPNPEDFRDTFQNRRILAVVTHRDDWNLTEEGRCEGFFVFLIDISLFL